MPRYRAKAELYVSSPQWLGNRLVKPDEVFESNDVPGRNWFPIDDAAIAAVVARFGEVSAERQQFWIGGAGSLYVPFTAEEYQQRK